MKRAILIAAISFGAFSFLSCVAFGESAVTTPIPAIPAAPNAAAVPVVAEAEITPPWKHSRNVTISTSRTLSLNDNPSYSGDYSFAWKSTYVPNAISISATASYSREYTYPRDDGSKGSFSNPVIGVSKAINLKKNYDWKILDSFSFGAKSAIPVGIEAQRQTFKGSLGTYGAATKTLGKWHLSQSFSYTRNFYEYDIRLNGVVNSPNRFASSSAIDFDVTEKISVSFGFVYDYALSFQGVGRSSNIATGSVSYQISNPLSLALGVSNSSGTLNPDGISNSIKFFDSEKAQAFFDISLSF